jgi:hypothetical protein
MFLFSVYRPEILAILTELLFYIVAQCRLSGAFFQRYFPEGMEI